jgi:hypothetical protein
VLQWLQRLNKKAGQLVALFRERKLTCSFYVLGYCVSARHLSPATAATTVATAAAHAAETASASARATA